MMSGRAPSTTPPSGVDRTGFALARGGADHETRLADAERALATVLDPELDEPVTALGFVSGVTVEDDGVAVAFRLPTYWCSPNFAWIMAEDMREALLALPWVRRATVMLADHLFADRINAAVNRGQGFGDTFADAGGDLAGLRATFRRKAYLGRMAALIDALRADGWSDADLTATTVGDLRRIDGGDLPRLSARYLELRTVFGGSGNDSDPAFRTPEGEDIAAAALPLFLRGIRMTRRGAEANGEMCRIYLRERSVEDAVRTPG